MTVQRRKSSTTWMASTRMRSASAISALSSMFLPTTICRLKVLRLENFSLSRVVKASISCLELGIEAFSSWMSCRVTRTHSSRSSNSFSKSSSLATLAEVSALAPRTALCSISCLHHRAISSFKWSWEWWASILRRATSTFAREKGRYLAGQSLTWTASRRWGLISSRMCFISLEYWTSASMGAESKALTCWS